MSQKTIQQLDEDSKATAVVYNHSNAKLFTRKSKVRKRRKEGFLSAFPCRKNEPSPSLTTMKPKRKPVSKSITSNTKQKLQVCVRTHLPQGPKTLCFHLNLETTISSLKRLIYRKIGVQPQRQRLNIRRNVQLCELLTLRENGVGDDEISLSVDELTEDGPKETCQFPDEVKRPQPGQQDETKELNKQKGETISEVQTQIDEPATGSEGPRVPRYRHVKQKLQIFILNPLLRGPRTLCFHLEPETPISFLKESIHRKIGVHPKHQRLLIRRNARSFQLLDLLTLNDCGVQQDENISVCLPTDGLLGGGQKAYPSPTIEPTTVAILLWSVSLAAIVVWILWRKQRKTSTRELNDKVPLSTTTGEDDEKGTGNETEMQQNDSEEDPSVSTVSDGDPVDDGYDGSKETLITKGQVQDPLLGIEKQQNERGQTSSEAMASGGDPAEHAVDRCADVLKTLYMTTGSYAQIIKWVDDKTRMVTAKLSSEKSGKSLLNYGEIFRKKTEDGNPFEVVFLTGRDGYDRDFLLENIAYDWAAGSSPVLQKFKFVAALKMVDLHQESDFVDAIYDQLLSQRTDVKRTDLVLFIDANPNKVLLILHGFDEFLTQYPDETKCGSINKILHQTAARGIQVLVSTNPSNFRRLVDQSLAQEPFLHLTVSGITEQYIEEYVRTFHPEEPAQAENLVEQIRSSELLSGLAKNWTMLPLLCLISRDSALPETMTRLLDEALKYIFTGHSDTSQGEISQVVISLGMMALSGLTSQKNRFSFEEREFEKDVLDKALQVGLLTRQQVWKGQESSDGNIQFTHKIFQDFCAAKRWQSLHEKDELAFQNILDEIENPSDFEHMFRFCCGDNPQCAGYVLNALWKSLHRPPNELAISCYFESQSSTLLSVPFIESVITEYMYVDHRSNDMQAAFMWFLKHVSEDVSGREHLARVYKLSVSYFNLSRHCHVFASCLTTMKCLCSVRFRNCTMSGSDLCHFLSALSLPGRAGNLTELEVSHSLSSDCDAETWTTGLTSMIQLQSLVLRSCHVNAPDILHIAAAAADMADLSFLNLSGNFKLGGNADVWVPQLQTLKNLRKLDLSGCNIDIQDMKCISAGKLKHVSNLDLSDNLDLGGHVKTLLALLKSMSHLETLKIRNCGVGSHEIVYLLEAINGMDSLMHFRASKVELNNRTHLNIKDCSLTAESMADILQSLNNWEYLVSLTFSAIHGLSGCAAVWAPHLRKFTLLRELKLQDCSLRSTDVEHLAAAVSRLLRLATLSLKGNRSLGGDAEAWAPSLKQMKYVPWLNLRDCSLTEKDLQHISTYGKSVDFGFQYVHPTTAGLLRSSSSVPSFTEVPFHQPDENEKNRTETQETQAL